MKFHFIIVNTIIPTELWYCKRKLAPRGGEGAYIKNKSKILWTQIIKLANSFIILQINPWDSLA